MSQWNDQRNDPNDMFYEEGQSRDEQGLVRHLAKVMGWMCVGLLTTFVTALLCYSSYTLTYLLLGTNAIYFIFVLQLVVVMGLSAGLRRIGPTAATVLFMLYAALTGVTFTTLAYLFETSSLIYVFGVTALTFVAMSLYGFLAKKDLSRMGALAFFGLIGILIAGLLNFIFRSSMLDFAITVIGIIVFIALTAYDVQRIKAMYLGATEQGADEFAPEVQKMAIYGAFTLYLDFINLFLKLLRLLARRKN